MLPRDVILECLDYAKQEFGLPIVPNHAPKVPDPTWRGAGGITMLWSDGSSRLEEAKRDITNIHKYVMSKHKSGQITDYSQVQYSLRCSGEPHYFTTHLNLSRANEHTRDCIFVSFGVR